MTVLTIGDEAPDFEIPRDGGVLIKLSAYRGKKVVLYFYPRDDTSGCTIEARGFSTQIGAFAAANSAILGVSKDTVTSHNDFRDKYDLATPLLSDAESDVCERYGVWHEKTVDSRIFMGIVRTTFLIDEKGKIACIWRNVELDGHVDAVLRATQDLQQHESS